MSDFEELCLQFARCLASNPSYDFDQKLKSKFYIPQTESFDRAGLIMAESIRLANAFIKARSEMKLKGY